LALKPSAFSIKRLITKMNTPPYEDLYIYYLKGRVGYDPVMDDPCFIGNWQEEEDAFLFFKQPAADRIGRILEHQKHLILVDQFEMPYEQWQGGKPAPYQAGSLEVVPPWHAKACLADSATIILDPGVVFGSGTHPTTSDCLTAIQLAFQHQRIRQVMDLGTGTGLLALSAARLGASRVVAVDLNGLAVSTARRNVLANSLASAVLVVQGDAKNFMDLSCDLMVSNIHYEIMRDLVTEPGFRVQKQFVLSGLLRSQAREIEYRLSQGPARILRKWDHDGIWYTFYGEHP
jgi:ribosomal protein L11 methyltransferase